MLEEHNCMLRNMRSSHRNLTVAYAANTYYKEVIEGDDLPCSRPVLYVDGTILTRKYRGHIVTAVGAYANN
ncbi:hypothetical protein E2562_038648 [Oryza meyeriana var. granulata]|uniref:Uncharacterized protein n=1 Tax=Oryza meyeriana var. granulata TaxID=110450 RepID=A0A6G1E7N7_9ORYZ|nr:hypothetical protein E2562_038648 [Oryza meyeriana var. granulata]